VAHVVLVVEAEAGNAELDAQGGEVDGEVVWATTAVERAAAVEGVIGGGKEPEEGEAKVVADEPDERLPVGLAEGGADAAVVDALQEGVEAFDGAAASKCAVAEQVSVVGGSNPITAAAAAATATTTTTAAAAAAVFQVVVIAFVITVVDNDWFWLRRRLAGYRLGWGGV
jgi:hypothetical protein